ncbi:GNAT family N-acetyltransferase [Halobacteria archaeon AArc-dxtr1]|nr:GNAT family N-acetyltransferase [Halobacteria archaeon AArc-dxtr1]
MDRTRSVTIERARPSDLETVADLWVALAREQRTHESAVLPDTNRAAMREILASYRLDGGLLVARLDDEIVGFASLTVEQGTLELAEKRGILSNLYVLPKARNQGIGTQLLRAAEDALRDRGVDVLTLEAMAANEGARRFYRREGYEPRRVKMNRRLDEQAKNDTHSKDEQ